MRLEPGGEQPGWTNPQLDLLSEGIYDGEKPILIRMKSVLALLQFTTVLPLGKPADFDAFAKHSWIYPLAGYVTGFAAAVPAILAAVLGYNNSPVVAALTIAVSLFISGGNHFDGLLDFGDGLMAHGSREKRIRAMTDRTTGAGALAIGMITLLLTFAALSSLPLEMIASAVITAEVCGKMIMGLSSALGKPFHEGIQSYIYGLSKRRFAVYTTLLSLPLLLFIPVKFAAAGILAGIFIFVSLLLLAKKLFGGVNGDVTGAGNELGKMMVCLVFAVLASA